MHQSKLFEFLRAFSPRQLARFGAFLDSPYFNKSVELRQFYALLEPFGPAFQDPRLEKQALLGHSGPAKPLTEKRLAYLMNQLLGLAEEFIAVDTMRADPLKARFQLVEAINPGHLPRHYKSALEKAAQALEQFPYRNADYFAERYHLKALQYWRFDSDPQQINPDLQPASDALDTFFLVEKLRFCWAMADFESIFNLKYDWGLSRWLLDYIDQTQPQLDPAAEIYLTGVRMTLHSEDTSWFYRLKALLHAHAGAFNESEQRFLYSSLINYCARRINRFNDPVFSREYLEINKMGLERGLLFENGLLSPWHYINLVNTALRTGDPGWALRFMEQYRDRLPAAYREDMYLMAMGQYHFHQGEYEQAQVLLHQTNPRDVQLAVLVRNLLSRIYYETGETELLLAFLEAYRIFLLRQNLLSPRMKRQARHFVDFTRRLAKIERPEAHLLPKLKAELPGAADIVHREWLERQIDQKMAAYKVRVG